MEKLKKQEQAEHRAKRALQYDNPNYLITRGPFSLDEETVNDGPVIALKGPQQDQSKLEEDDQEKAEEKKGGK